MSTCTPKKMLVGGCSPAASLNARICASTSPFEGCALAPLRSATTDGAPPGAACASTDVVTSTPAPGGDDDRRRRRLPAGAVANDGDAATTVTAASGALSNVEMTSR